MIIGIVGGIGSGKSVYVTKKIVESKKKCFVNFPVNSANALRLRKEHIILEEEDEKGKSSLKLNWKFWNDALKKYKDYNLVLDEFHNIAHSRQSQTKWNTLMSIWISQIRKVLGTSETTHIFLVSQKIRRIDVAFRDLMHSLIHCQKYMTLPLIDTVVVEDGKEIVKQLPMIWIITTYFFGENLESKYLGYLEGYKTYSFKTSFLANPYLRYYDSYQLFGDTGYL